MSDAVLGIGGQLGHDGNAALIVDGRLVAASQEERYTRRKHDAAFPREAIEDCLAIAGIAPDDVSVCVFAEKPVQSLLYDRSGLGSGGWARWLSRLTPEGACEYQREARRLFPGATFRYAWHHLSHAAAAFATSPFERAAFLCVDGKGEDVNATIGVIDARATRILYELPCENGLGLLYSLVTCLLGFPTFGSEYKVMGLAPYGEPTRIDSLERFVRTDADGALQLARDARFTAPAFDAAVASLARHLDLPPRTAGGPLDESHVDLAASVQALFEAELLKMAAYARRATGERNLVFCGGCAQNCVAAGALRRSGLFDEVFNSPVGGDMASAVGAALLYEQQRGRDMKIDASGYCLGSLPGSVPSDAARWTVPFVGSIHAAAARLIAEGYVVGWVRGRMELGARALGARSILADPRVPDMQSRLNLKVKFRESFRPFAPAVLAEDCADWFDSSEPSDFMQYTAYLRPERRRPAPQGLKGLRERRDYARCAIPGTVHVDYSARLQTVRREVHPDFHRLICEFKRLTGVPVVINTSFNVSGEPIVRTAADAWQCFRHTDIDYLVVGDGLYRNPNDKSREDKLAWARQFERYS